MSFVLEVSYMKDKEEVNIITEVPDLFSQLQIIQLTLCFGIQHFSSVLSQ